MSRWVAHCTYQNVIVVNIEQCLITGRAPEKLGPGGPRTALAKHLRSRANATHSVLGPSLVAARAAPAHACTTTCNRHGSLANSKRMENVSSRNPNVQLPGTLMPHMYTPLLPTSVSCAFLTIAVARLLVIGVTISESGTRAGGGYGSWNSHSADGTTRQPTASIAATRKATRTGKNHNRCHHPCPHDVGTLHKKQRMQVSAHLLGHIPHSLGVMPCQLRNIRLFKISPGNPENPCTATTNWLYHIP